MNLVPAIKSIEEEIRKIEYETKKKIQPYQESLEALRKLNTACEACNGEGKILRSRACAEDDAPDPDDPRDYIKCVMCGGSGQANPKYIIREGVSYGLLADQSDIARAISSTIGSN